MQLADNLRRAMDAYGIAGNQLARSLGFDPSYISRILSGQRRPADVEEFAHAVAAYIARNNADAEGARTAAELTGEAAETLVDADALECAIARFLAAEDAASPSSMETLGGFLVRLDEFDLDAFKREIKFGDIKVPTAPFQLPTTKTYSGIEQMKQAELDFLKAAVLSKSTDDVILYSDMPLGEMAADEEFPKKIMLGMAMLIKKGVRLLNIHDVHRPFDELVMGLEGWLPIYITGQIEPYYLPHPTNDVFLHFLRSAGTVAVLGEAIAGNQGGGRYIVTKAADDVAYARRRAEELLAHAKPFMRIFHKDVPTEATQLEHLLSRLDAKAGATPVRVGEGAFQHMEVTVVPGTYALINKGDRSPVTIVIEYPALVDALEKYEPVLF